MNKYQPRLPLYPHQEEALRKGGGQKSFAYLMAMRTGKTATVLADFGQLEFEGKCPDLLVIAPAGVYRTWETAIREHCSDDLWSRIINFTWVSGLNKIGQIKLGYFLQPTTNPRSVLMNVEALSRPGIARELCIQFLLQRSAMCVIDESTIIKNNSAKCTKFIVSKLGPLAKYKRILSGLATPRSPMDLFSQFEFLDWEILGYRSFFAFRNQYAVMKSMYFGGRRVQVIDGFRNENDLRARIEPYSYRVEFRPKIPSTYTIREVSMTEEQERLYREIKEYATAQLNNEHITATAVITQILKLHQILCGHVLDENGKLQVIKENRTSELLELLEEYDGKAIIWCSYQHDVQKLALALRERYGADSAVSFWGGNVNTREFEEQQFLQQPDCRFMIATPSAGGRGRTWSNADLVVYYSSTNNLEHREQSEQRAMGLNKDRQVDFVDLITPNTVEIKILEALRKKIDMAATINGDNFREWLI